MALERKRVLLVGRVNSGKSTLFNRLLRQKRSLTSDLAGTTTDSVAKSMELAEVGPILLVDTPGLSDASALGKEREEVTQKELATADLILYLISKGETLPSPFLQQIPSKVAILPVIAQADCYQSYELDQLTEEIQKRFDYPPVIVSALKGKGIDELLQKLSSILKKETENPSLLGNLCKKGDTVLLVMPQDSAAPKGRLILPQVQTIRALLDRQCSAICTTPEELSRTLSILIAPPQLIITDSQVFAMVEKQTPSSTLLTSFSILMSAERGDLTRFVLGAKALDKLSSHSHILIAEACTHAPQGEDIGTIKIPRMLRKRFGESLKISFVAGKDFPEDLTPYDAVIHCGGCMFNRRLLVSRQDLATAQGIAMTNYGIAIAYLTGILNKVALP